MILRFDLFERLGYNDEVSNLSEHIWKLYKRGQREINLSDYTKKNMSIFVNKLFIREYFDSSSKSIMCVYYDTLKYKKTKNLKMDINRFHRPTLASFEHEIKHLYDFIKSDGFLKMKDKILLSPFNELSTEDTNIDKFLYIMYIIEMNEIEAYYHSDVRNFKDNNHKFNNSIKKYIKYSRLKKKFGLL